jgi:hypothetical protein
MLWREIGIDVDDEKVYTNRVRRKSAGKTSSMFLKNRWTKIILALIVDVAKKENMFLLARNMYALIRRPCEYSTRTP